MAAAAAAAAADATHPRCRLRQVRHPSCHCGVHCGVQPGSQLRLALSQLQAAGRRRRGGSFSGRRSPATARPLSLQEHPLSSWMPSRPDKPTRHSNSMPNGTRLLQHPLGGAVALLHLPHHTRRSPPPNRQKQTHPPAQ